MRKYNLQDILSREIEFEETKRSFDQIQIPIIQRDYAQGRDEQKTVRNRFLKALFGALKDRKNLDLDFVYGAIKMLDSKDIFILLDGQQRLTTLFLLHWYIGNRELTEKPEKLTRLKTVLGKFTYATRNTSSRFCERLIKTTVTFSKPPSHEIRDSSWFYDVFDLDPTVKSMLNMIDAIHAKYGAEKLELFDSLEKLKFYVLPLNGFELTDELYVKMNARGKPLTGFENFKADLFKWLKTPENETYKFSSKVQYQGRNLKYHFVLELKFDIDWTGLFWKYSKTFEKQDEKLVDTYFFHFINRYLLNRYILEVGINFSDLEANDIFKSLYNIEKTDKKLTYNSFENYEKVFLLNPEKITTGLEKVLDGLIENLDQINELSRPNWEAQDWKLFNTSISQRQRIVLLAISSYLEKNTFDEEKFKDWMRIVWNIIIDPNLRSVPAMANAMSFISKLSDKCDEILSHIANVDFMLFENENTFRDQLEEEHIKSQLILEDIRWKEEIIKAESHDLFQGKIKFLLTNETQKDIDLFIIYRDTAISIFDGNDLKDKPENYLWLRALLSKCVVLEVDKKGIDLSNGNFNNWRDLINGIFAIPMQSLIKDIIDSDKPAKVRMVELCSEYELNKEIPWLFHLVKWEGENGETLLGDYSNSRKIKRYNNYGRTRDYVYLFNQNIWTDGNILLETNRNELVSHLLKKYQDLMFSNKWLNIQNMYFRDWDVKMTRIVEGIQFTISVTREDIYVGVKESDDTNLIISQLNIPNKDKQEGWSFRRKYNFENYTLQDLNQVIYHLNEDIFNDQNPNSLIRKIKAK
jgi:hypothetical protein